MLSGVAGDIARILEPFTFYRRAEHVGLALPELVETWMPVTLTAPQKMAYARAAMTRDGLARSNQMTRACLFAEGRSATGEAAAEFLLAQPADRKAVLWMQNLEHLRIVTGLPGANGIGHEQITGVVSLKDRRRVLGEFRDNPTVRVLAGTNAIDTGTDGLQHAGLLVSCGDL